MEFFSPKTKKFEEGTFRAQKIKKHTLKSSLIFQEIELSSPKLIKLIFFLKKVFLIFQERTCKV